MTEKNGVISKWLLGILGAVIVGCTLGWVSWVYGNVETLNVTVKAHEASIAVLQENIKNFSSNQLRTEQKIDKLLDMHLNK